MTILADPPVQASSEPTPEPLPDHRAEVLTGEQERPPLRLGPLLAYWAAVTLAGIAVVLVAIGPITEERDQRALLEAYRTEIESASNQAFGLDGMEVPTHAPAPGSPVAVLDIEDTRLSRVVVEGADPDQTRQGPGHVVGTGGPGQPGNSVIVARRNLFGGAFADLGQVEEGDRILVTTTQGRSVYVVGHVGTHTIEESDGSASAATAAAPPPSAAGDDGAEPAPDQAVDAGDDAATDEEPLLPDGTLSTDEVFGASPDDRLTLVTTASGLPGSGEAVVVVARLDGQAYAPTPQGGRTAGSDGRSGTSGFPAALVLAVLIYVVAIAGSIWLYRSVPWRSAYLLSAPVLVALTVVMAEQIATMLPAWT